jgi:hypothetical protein
MIFTIFINLVHLNYIFALPNYNTFEQNLTNNQPRVTQKFIPNTKPQVTPKFIPNTKPRVTQKPIPNTKPQVTQKPISNINPQVTQKPIPNTKPQVIQTPIPDIKPQITQTPQPIIVKNIPITFGDYATITYFTDSIFQCISGQPIGNAVAINPLLLGFTINDWNNLYKNADPSKIPWCNKTLTLTVNGETFKARIIDTCNPTNDPSDSFIDPKTGKIIGGPCNYQNTIDIYGENGLAFLNKISNGDDFYNGNGISWSIQ